MINICSFRLQGKAKMLLMLLKYLYLQFKVFLKSKIVIFQDTDLRVLYCPFIFPTIFSQKISNEGRLNEAILCFLPHIGSGK